MSSKTEIANLALSHLGIAKEIANLDTENSPEASACRRFYEHVKELTLAEIEWPFATRFVVLGLIEEDPNDEWNFSYRYPSNCIAVRRILSGHRDDTLASIIKYKIGRDTSGKVIYTDQDQASVEYTENITDSTIFPSDFVMAMSYLLAVYIAPRVTGGDPFKLKDSAFAAYTLEVSRAKSNAVNEEKREQLTESPTITARI